MKSILRIIVIAVLAIIVGVALWAYAKGNFDGWGLVGAPLIAGGFLVLISTVIRVLIFGYPKKVERDIPARKVDNTGWPRYMIVIGLLTIVIGAALILLAFLVNDTGLQLGLGMIAFFVLLPAGSLILLCSAIILKIRGKDVNKGAGKR